MTRALGIGIAAAAVVLWGSAAGAAEKQIRPFVGVTFGGSTTFVDLEKASGKANPAIGVSTLVIGEMFGVEADFAHAPGFFQWGDSRLVLTSSVTTLTGNVMVAMPRRWTEYTLRPYFVGGAGMMRVKEQDYFDVYKVSELFFATNFGGGATGFLTNRVGVAWEARYFRAHSREVAKGLTLTGTSGELSFWRASMALAIRY